MDHIFVIPCKSVVHLIFVQYHFLKNTQWHICSHTVEHQTGSCNMHMCDLLNIKLHAKKLQHGLNSMPTCHTIHAFSWNSIIHISLLNFTSYKSFHLQQHCVSTQKYKHTSQKYNFWSISLLPWREDITGGQMTTTTKFLMWVQVDYKAMILLFAENTMVGTKQNYNWNACIFKYSILGEKKESRIGIQYQKANVELRIEKS